MSARPVIALFAVASLAGCLDFSGTPSPHETTSSGGETAGGSSGSSSGGSTSSGAGSSSGSSGGATSGGASSGSSAGAGPVAPTLDAWGFSAFAVSDNPRLPNTAPAQNPWPNDALHNQVIGADPSATLDFTFSVPVVALASHLTIIERTFANGSTPPSVPRQFTVNQDLNPAVFHVSITGGTANNPYAIEWSLDSALSDGNGTPISGAKPLSGTFRVAGIKNLTLTSESALDGYLYWGSGMVKADIAGTTIEVGCFPRTGGSGYGGRGYVSFVLAVPQAEFTHLTSATFAATQESPNTTVDNPSPYDAGPLEIVPGNYGQSLTASTTFVPLPDCNPACKPRLELATDTTLGVHPLAVSKYVGEQLHDAAHNRSQFKLDHEADALCLNTSNFQSVWESGNDGIDPPTLSLQYNWLGPATFP